MSIPHPAPYANGAHPPVPMCEDIGEHIADNGEGIADTLARLADRLAVLATAAHIMERRAPRDVYARSIAHEACVLALDMRETLHRAQAGAPMRSPVIVDASPASSPTEAPPEAPEDGERSTHRATHRDGHSSTRARAPHRIVKGGAQ